MSRVGKLPVLIPEGVNIEISGNYLSVSGKLGKLSRDFPQEVRLIKSDDSIKVEPANESKRSRAMWGLSRALVEGMVTGVSQGFEKKLEIVGVGYRAAVDNKYLTLSLGYSHDIKFEIPEGISIKAIKPTLLSVSGYSKEKVGQVASLIVRQRPPEPYKGKGVNYLGRYIPRKEGKKK